MSDVTKAEDVVPISLPIVSTPLFGDEAAIAALRAAMLRPIPMNWPQDWEAQEQPCTKQYYRLYVKPPGWSWVQVDIELPVENEIIIRVDNSVVFSNWQYGGILQSLVTTYAHKLAMRVWHGIESK